MKRVEDIPLVPPRPHSAHKGTFGTVIVIGGSDTMIGAPALTARAAFRSGAGLVKIACQHSILPHVLSVEPSATGIAIGGEPEDALAQIEHADPQQRAVLAVGPGLGQDARTAELVMALIKGSRPIVLDADGLNMLAKRLDQDPRVADNHAPLVLTPHPGEYKRLADTLHMQADPTDPSTRVEAASKLAQQLNATVVLKGQHSVIADKHNYAINTTGNPALATAGSGDVLTGLIASLLAQGMAPFGSCQLGSHLHGLAADQWIKQHGSLGLRAIELADQLPHAFAALA
ncbi:MAG: NAD(P)H-hydrate dehydratase [Planctomycetota bacterium]